ncbi:MAG TPA: ABC transporter ATP-binding protein [Spirochaetales bacterium]|nr:ABC transporter ATP-binding protein [Spirochaetales bacterium]
MEVLLREFHIENFYPYNRKSAGKWILSHVARYSHLPILMIFASLVNNTAYGNIQVYIGKSFDRILLGPGESSTLLPLVLIIVASAVVQGLTGLVRNYSIETLAQRLERDCREEYYVSLLEKSQTFHGKQRVGDLMARATYDVHALNLMFSPGFMLIVDSFLAYLIPMVMIGNLHFRLLLIPVLFSVLIGITLVDYNRRLEPVSLAQQEQHGKISAEVEEILTGIATVKSNVQERFELQKFLSNVRIFRDYFIQQGIIQARYWPMLVFALMWGGALFHGLYLWKTGVISLGTVIGFMGLFSTFRFVTYTSLFSVNTVQHGLASARRILEIINTKTELDQNLQGVQKRIEGSVEFDTVFFSYDGALVLRRINFSVDPGKTVALVGGTGAGKTTLTRLINRTFDPVVGSVRIDEIDAREWNLASLRSQIAFIEQDIFLFSRTIRENIAFGKEDASEEEIIEAAKQAQAHEFILSFKDGYDTLVGDRGVMLSGGQRQRIAIARAFLTDPRILILDDSTSAIDSRTEDEIQKAMRNVSRNRTTFIITHRLSQIRWADLILVLKKGELVAQGTHEELLETSDEYRSIFVRLPRGKV